MNARFANESEIAQWNQLILTNPDSGNVFQGAEFAEQKKLGGWTPRHIIVDSLAVTILEKPVIGLGKLWYIPKGPGVTSAGALKPIFNTLREFAKAHGAFMLKIEPEFIKSSEIMATLTSLGLTSVSPIQPNFSTVLLDTTADLDTILSSLNQKGRHAIKRAERDGVTVQRVDSTNENCQIMYRLLADTAKGSFRIRNYTYYQTFWQRYSQSKLGQLFFAYVDGEIVAGAYAIAFGTKGTYKDGASIRERTVYGASHLLQWHVITWMKENGVAIHDFCGAPPSDQIKNEQHAHYGIGRFKTSFSKHVTDYVGAFDLPINSIRYKIWSTIGERLAIRLHNRRYHENYY